jgi:DNA adenine methylase
MAKPFFKWAGGKAALLPKLAPLLPKGIKKRRWVEPFLGGGAFYLSQEPARAALGDANRALICTWYFMRDDHESLIDRVVGLCSTHTEARYYKRRDLFNESIDEFRIETAALFLYLNKSCFNGLYRVNKQGVFNVPCGDYKKVAVDVPSLKETAAYLSRTHIDLYRGGYVEMLTNVCSGDFVYLDPPYDAGFVAYTQYGFGETDQTLLAENFRSLAKKRGVRCMLSNADTPFIRKLYKNFDIQSISAPRSVNNKGTGRGAVPEVVVRNYKS